MVSPNRRNSYQESNTDQPSYDTDEEEPCLEGDDNDTDQHEELD